ncbi:hypothetical protein D3C81_2201200 [compost metagenome]
MNNSPFSMPVCTYRRLKRNRPRKRKKSGFMKLIRSRKPSWSGLRLSSARRSIW